MHVKLIDVSLNWLLLNPHEISETSVDVKLLRNMQI